MATVYEGISEHQREWIARQAMFFVGSAPLAADGHVNVSPKGPISSLAVLDLGVAYATLQCAELLRRGAPGIHFYTLNRSPATRAILHALRLHQPWRVR